MLSGLVSRAGFGQCALHAWWCCGAQCTGDHESLGGAQAVSPLQLCWSFDVPVILFHQVNPDYEEDDLECQSSVSIGKGMVSPLLEEGLAQAQD